ncbi:MAG: hypothetical protein NUV45_10940 [Tepidanaerobacteraceae bacterium]|nr:hypothetical protein [Tepidanaerobacteraceae bacterium]
MNNIKAISDAFCEQNTALENFFKQSRTNLSNISNMIKNIQDGLLAFKNDIDNTLKQIEMDIEQNKSIFAKWFDGSNTKLRQEQISQKRMALLEGVKKINEGLTQFSQELSRSIDEFDTASKQFAIDYKNLENQLKTGMNNISTSVIPTSGRNDSITSANPAVQNLLEALQQAINALNAAQQGLQQRKVFYELNRSLDNMVH